jgi:membrane fusion protein, heavy metal efflux system
MKYLGSLMLACLVASGCRPPAPSAAAEEEPEPLAVTRWTDRTELFAEYAPLAVGDTSRFAIHLTRLDTFQPLPEGTVEVRLHGGSHPPEVFRVERPSRPGIFGVDVTPSHPGPRELVVVLRSRGIDDEHHVGAVEVRAHGGAAGDTAGDTEDEAPGISFLKEQQWNLDFATAVVSPAALRQSIRVPARVEPRQGGTADVAAPIGGRLTFVVDLPLGAPVTRGQELARLLPPPASPASLPQLQRDHTEAGTALALAVRDRERAERLTTSGAAPEKRLDEARAAEEQARARLAASEKNLALFDAARTGSTIGAEGLFVVRAPIGGVLAQRTAATGANVSSGTTLFRIVDPFQVHVVGQVPEAEATRIRDVSAAELEVPGDDERMAVGRLASMGRVLDAQSRTLPITFSFDNRTAGLPVGQAVFLHLLMDTSAPTPVVPVNAVVDDAGQPIVFVQTGGETFERRAVVLGARSGQLVQVTSGVRVGDRIVTRGAYLVRLASLSTSVPAHGHVH